MTAGLLFTVAVLWLASEAARASAWRHRRGGALPVRLFRPGVARVRPRRLPVRLVGDARLAMTLGPNGRVVGREVVER